MVVQYRNCITPVLAMWFESVSTSLKQNCAMMGVHVNSDLTGKRKLEAVAPIDSASPPKVGRWEADDCLARLQAVAVPPLTRDVWFSSAASRATTCFSNNDDDECSNLVTGCDDLMTESENEPIKSLMLFDAPRNDDICGNNDDFANVTNSDFVTMAHLNRPPASSTPSPPTLVSPVVQDNRLPSTYHHSPDYWQYYQPPQQQTIRCEENGKSYLELGAATTVSLRSTPAASVSSPTSSSHPPHSPPPHSSAASARWIACYRQRRLAVLNLSMCKLARYRQCSDPSLRRSVLICNTLRRLEREIETEPPDPPLHMVQPSEEQLTMFLPTASSSPLTALSSSCEGLPYDDDTNGRITPFPTLVDDTDSGLGDMEYEDEYCEDRHESSSNLNDDQSSLSLDPCTFSSSSTTSTTSGIDNDNRPINWGSVLSLSSQGCCDLMLSDSSSDFYTDLMTHEDLMSCTTSSDFLMPPSDDPLSNEQYWNGITDASNTFFAAPQPVLVSSPST